MLIITDFIAKHELKPLRKYFDIKDLLDGADKVLKNLATQIKPPQNFPDIRFFKVRIGGTVKGRMIVFMITENKKIVPVLIRLKKDKIFGMNMAMNNPQVVSQIKTNLDRIFQDIQAKRFQQF